VSALGTLDTCLHAIHAGLQRLSPRLGLESFVLVAQPVPPGLAQAAPSGSVGVRLAAPNDPVLSQVNRPPEELQRRFASPGVCLVAEKGSRLVGFLWLLFGAYREPDGSCEFELSGSDCAWDLDVFVVPQERLGRSFVRLWEAANAVLRERRIRWSMSRISAFNPRSLSSHRALGAVKVGRISFLRLFDLQLFCGTVRPFVKLSVVGRGAPRIRVKPPA